MANASIKPDIDENNVNIARSANFVGAFISFALFFGVIGWGAQTLMRDSSGVPVVRALDGPMRVAPTEPGGVPASHQGLTVNQVSSSQIIVPVGEPLRLAPRPINLRIEDIAIPKKTKETISDPINHQKTGGFSIPTGIIEPPPAEDTIGQLAAMLAATNLSSTSDSLRKNIMPTNISTALEVPNLTLGTLIRPKVRPKFLLKPELQRKMTKEDGKAPLGTQMVQLGAFSDKQAALQAWKMLSERYGNYFVGKENIILNAKIADQEIYRLRVYGFNDINEARRLCTALQVQQAECYPVVIN
jgi:hypothetical protein